MLSINDDTKIWMLSAMTQILGQSDRDRDVGTDQIQIFEICKSIFFQTEVFEN